MKKTILTMLAFGALGFASVFAWTGCLDTGTQCNTTTLVEVEILPGNLCIGSTWSFDFGNYTVSNSAQTVSGTVSDPFYVDDLRWSNSWYYTTVQLSWDLLQSWWSGSIPAANLFMKTAAVGSGGITTITGYVNPRVEIEWWMIAFQSLDVARELIIRDPALNFGLVGMYGVLPELQLIIPPYQAVGTYTATLYYTLYEN